MKRGLLVRGLFIVGLAAPLPGCNRDGIESAGTKAQSACETAVRVCAAAGGILGWSSPPDAFSVADIPAEAFKPVSSE